MPRPIPKPHCAEEVLAAVAVRYAAGSTVTLPMIAEVGGVNLATAGQIRQWARAQGHRLRPRRDIPGTPSSPP
jgi:hypothetical protein